MNINFKTVAEEGIVKCEIFTNNKLYHGEAKCCDSDMDFFSEKTGMTIAHLRCILKIAKDKRNETKIKLDTLQSLYTIYSNANQKFTETREYRILKKQIYNLEDEWNAYQTWYKQIKVELTTLISKKDKLYNTIRKYREKNEK